MGRNLFNRIPIAWRITGWYSIFLILMLFLLATFTIQFISIWEDTQMRSDLEQHMVSISDNPSSYISLKDGIYTILYSKTGYIMRGMVPETFPINATPSPDKITRIDVNGKGFYYYDVKYTNSKFSGIARGIVPISSLQKRTTSIALAFLAGGITFIIIATIGGYWLIRLGLRPIRKMTETAAEIGSRKDLSRRVEHVDGADEIHKLSVTLNDMLESLERSHERERQFSSDVSHELRTPIAVIQAESDYCRNYAESLEEAKESFEHIFTQSKNMGILITQLLELARLENQKEIIKEPMNISTYLLTLLKDYSKICKEKNILLTYEITPDLTLNANSILLNRAIGNLIDNAIKFTKDSIHISCQALPGNHISLAVTDNGAGIDTKDLEKVCERLYQTETSRNKKSNGGIGLGLYFVQNVVKLHDGNLKITSIPNKETTFQIVI